MRPTFPGTRVTVTPPVTSMKTVASTTTQNADVSMNLYLPPEVARGAYFHRRDVSFGMKYISECTDL